MTEIVEDYDTDFMRNKIQTEIKKCNKISERMKQNQYNFLYVIFWIGIKLENLGYNKYEIEQLVSKLAFKIKFTCDRWEYAIRYLKKIKPKLK